jgi:hypothetical protein
MQNVPQVNSISPLPHEPVFSGSAAANDATVDIPLGGAKVGRLGVIPCLAFLIIFLTLNCLHTLSVIISPPLIWYFLILIK